MRELVVERNESISRLAWGANVTPGQPVAAVVGPWVDVGGDFLMEGCWNGQFGCSDFDDSYTFMGSGLIVRDTDVIVVAPCNTTEAVYSLESQGGILFSNSIPMLLRLGDATLDPDYLNYEPDFLSVVDGLKRYRDSVPLANGRAMGIHYYCNLIVDSNGAVTRQQKPSAASLHSYIEYRKFLSEELAGSARNARDSRRIHQYEPIVFCSAGYDSSACAALGREIGCDEAVVFESKKGTRSDTGRFVVEALGYRVVHEKHELDYLSSDDAHLFLSSGELGSAAFFLAAAEELEGRMFLSGVHGDAIWSTDGLPSNPDLIRRSHYPTAAYKEFRLAVGYLYVAPPYYAVSRHDDIYRLSNAEEMAPWRLGSDYDRPVPRRILEEAGVPRTAFGHVKTGGAGSTMRFGTLQMLKRVMPRGSYHKFAAYVQQRRPHRNSVLIAPLRSVVYTAYLAATFLSMHGVRFPARLLNIESWPRKFTCSPFAPSLLFEWAVDETQRRQYDALG